MPETRTRLVPAAAIGLVAATAIVTGALVTGSLVAGATSAAAAPTSAPACKNASLAVTRTFLQGGAGHSWLSLIYRNTTDHTCTVYGYPGLDALGRKGHVIAHATRGKSDHVATVRIRPGKYASASVEWLNFNGKTGGSCRFGTSVKTIVAGTSRVHRFRVSVSVCELQVFPTVAGTPQYPNYGPAQHDWIVGSTVDAAGQNRYFLKAEHQLKKSKDYPEQVKTLAQLRSFPDTGLTHKQAKQARADVRTLNSFFGTPGLYF